LLHRQSSHATKRGLVTVAGSPGSELHPKTLASILKQAGLSREAHDMKRAQMRSAIRFTS
jgi:hypothetical protein